MQRTIAVVVTHNRQQLLTECIDALRKQTHRLDKILVINNGSSDNTATWLNEQDDIAVITQDNRGSGDAFGKGIQWGYERGFEWIWCMDDDGYPKNDALKNLLTADIGNEIALLNCVVINKEDKRSFVWKTQQYTSLDNVDCELIHGKGHPFNGTLIHRKIIERVGVPEAKLFLWGDETEYYYRITRKNKIPVITVTSSIHFHPSSFFSLRKDWDYASSWKMYYYIRNRLAVHKSKFQNKAVAVVNYICFIVAFFGIILIFQKTNKFKKLAFLFWPLSDAIFNKYQSTPASILSRLRKNAGISG
jgi:rhamnopyranosyl-N-acetylglucosaminyl-diphospho-decaprenol beta-1,3/1,4-galactofuranosyltransferase